MSPADMSSLHDAYQLIDEMSASKQTSYILQFLWRDLTSSFDVVGPYFTSSSQLESKFIVSCILQSLRIFHLYGFHTCAVVCDGASANVSALKSTCGTSGAYGIGPTTSTDRHNVKPYFSNPFDPDQHIFWLICPSHQVSMCLCVCIQYHYVCVRCRSAVLPCTLYCMNMYTYGNSSVCCSWRIWSMRYTPHERMELKLFSIRAVLLAGWISTICGWGSVKGGKEDMPEWYQSSEKRI